MPIERHFILGSGGDLLRAGGLSVTSSHDPLDVGPSLRNGLDRSGLDSQSARLAFWSELPYFPDAEYVRHQRDVVVQELSEPVVQANVDGGRAVLWWGPTLSESLFVARLVEHAVARSVEDALWVVDRHLDTRGGPLWCRPADPLLTLARRPRRLTAHEIRTLAQVYTFFCQGDLAGFLSSSRGEQPFLSIHDRISDPSGLSPVDRRLLVAARVPADVRAVVGAVMGACSPHTLLPDSVLYWRLGELLAAGHLRITRPGPWPRVGTRRSDRPIRPIGLSWSVEDRAGGAS